MINKIINSVSNLLICLPFVLVAQMAVSSEVEAKKDLEIYKEATNKSDVVGTLKSGDSAESVERKGMFWQIKMKSGASGFVSVLSVKHKAESSGNLAKAIKNVVKQGRADEDDSDSRQRSAVMGVRGLAADDSASNAGSIRPNLRAVFAMEDHDVRKNEVEALGAEVFAEIEKSAGL